MRITLTRNNRAGREVRAGNLEVVIVKADEIRKQWDQSMLEHQQADNLPYVVADVLVEIAAQLSEANEHLKRIAYPLIVNEEAKPEWAWFEKDGKKYPVKIDQVAAVTPSNAEEVFIALKNGGGAWAEGTVVEVAKKLGIPTE